MGTSETKEYYAAIDGLRALAVLSVVLYHLDARLLPGGFVGVDIFFVISGFVVSLSMARFHATGFPGFATHFYARRVLRIAPALLVCLLATTVASVLFIPHAWLSDTQWRTGLAAFFGLSNIDLARPSNDYFSPKAEFNPFTHTWSLAVEEQFYLIFPAMFYFWRGREGTGRRERTVLGLFAVGTLVSLLICAWWSRGRPTFAFYLLPSRFWELGGGVLLFLTRSAWQPLLARRSRQAMQVLVAIALLGLVAGMVVTDAARFPFPGALLPVLCTLVLLAAIVARADAVLPAPLTSAPVRWIGRISYSLYLWHWPVFVLLRWTIGIEPPANKLLGLASAVALAALSYRWVETPIRTWPGIRSIARWRVVVAGLACTTLAGGFAGLLFHHDERLSLSVTADSAVWEPSAALPAPAGSRDACRLGHQWRGVGAVSINTHLPEGCDRPAGRLIVAGDSHAGAYGSMLMTYAMRSGHEVRTINVFGCAVFSLMRPMLHPEPQCVDSASQELALVDSEVGPGDVLFLPSLRLVRFRDQWGGAEIRTVVDPVARRAAVDEAIARLRPLGERGVKIVFEAPKPLFRSPLFRCSDWFNATNPICAGGFELRREEFERLRRDALGAMGEVVRQVPGAAIWDPAEVLCDATACRARSTAGPLFFDGDHLTRVGNAALYPSFQAAIDRSFH